MNKNVFHHRGYMGSIEVSVEDNCLYGQILYVNDLVNYFANSPADLEEEFKKAVDDYLVFCEKEGLLPDKPFKGSFNIRITPQLHKEASIIATSKGQSLNEFIRECIQEGVRSHEGGVVEHHTHNHVYQVQFSKADELRPAGVWEPFEEGRHQLMLTGEKINYGRTKKAH